VTEVNGKVKWAFRLGIYGLLIYGVYYAVSANGDSMVYKRAAKFCHGIYAGAGISELVDEAQKQGATLMEGNLSNKSAKLQVFVLRFASGGAHKGYECRMVAANGMVNTKELYPLD
jgi:hypothetical protein